MDAAGPNLVRNPFWNINSPKDVNADGRISAFDAIAIINQLNVKGAHSLATAGAALPGAGENQGPSAQGFLDVNNDNYLSAMDALQVINFLNSGGEGPPMVRLEVQVVAKGTNTDLTTINKGDYYELRVLTQDLGVLAYMNLTRPASPQGVQTSFFDLLYNRNLTDFQVNDVQNLQIFGADEDGSPTAPETFRITVNDDGVLKTTAPITIADALSRTTTARNMQTALNTLLGANTVEVQNFTDDASPSDLHFRIRFINRMADKDVPNVTAAAVAGLPGSTFQVTEVIKGLPTNSAAIADALAIRPFINAAGLPLNSRPAFYQDQRSGTPIATGIDNLGGTQFFSPYPGSGKVEIARLRMNAEDAGLVNFNLDVINVPLGLETGVVGFGVPVTTDLITVVGDSITITEPLSAGDDTATTTEGSTTPIDIVVTTNDVNNAPTPSTPKTVQSVDLTGTLGSAVKLNASTIRYTPPGGTINGIDTFKYTVTDQNGNSDTATVTVTITPVNNAPVVNGPTTQNMTEDVSRVFNSANGNLISITDVDAGAGLVTLTLNVGAGNGTLTLGSLAGLTNTTGNGTSTVTTSGTVGDLNLALNGLTYVPTPNLNGPVTLAVTANDNGNTGGGPLQGSRNIAISIAAVNDAPTVNLAGFTITPLVVEGDPLVLNAANNTLIAVADVDSGANPVQVTLHVSTGNTIHINTTSGVTIGTNDTNNVTLTGTVANINTALNGMTYTAAIGFGPANETLQITINDQGNTGSGGALDDTESVTITVDAAIRPRARTDSLTVDEDSFAGPANTVDVLNGDLVNEGSQARLISFSATSVNGGTITLDPGPTGSDTDDKLIYVPAPNFSGTDSFTYVMNDTSGLGADSIGTVNVTVREENDAPDAVDDSLSSIAEDSGDRTILATTLFANDSKGPPSESNQTLAIIAVGSPVGGTVTIVSGNVVFSPTPNYNGPASFTYTITDNGQTNGVNDFKTDSATVSFTITEVNDTPTAVNASLATIAEDAPPITIPFATLLTGATAGPANENGQTLTISNVSSPVGGTVAIVGTDVVFTPNGNFNGTASFVFSVTDNGTTNGVSDPKTTTATASFTVTASNDAPVAGDDTTQTGEEQPMDISVLANDFDVDVAPFTGVLGQVSPGTTISIVTPPPSSEGGAIVVGNQIRFTPATGFFGTSTFTYQLNDNSGAPNNLSNVATVTVTVVERNDPPVVANDSATLAEDAVNFPIDILANDTDPDTAKSNWSVTIVTQPQHGTAVFNTTTRVIDYTPALNYNGPDSFVYKVNDQSPIAPTNLESGNATVTLTITEVNDAPIANPDPASGRITVIENRSRTFTVASLLANDFPGPANESSQTITLVSVSNGTHGTVTLSGGVITYTPDLDYEGDDTFTYTIIDNGTTAGSPDPKTAVGNVNVVVQSFIPTNVVGYAYIDANNNGVFEPTEHPLSGVSITLSGTSDINGVITPITVKTNADGFYQFPEVEPGTYTLTESQPFALRDGKETAGEAASLSATNDQINLILPLDGIPGQTSFNYFGELGINAAALTNSSGLSSELLASSTNTGFVLAATLSGNAFWSWALNGWDGCDGIAVTLDADLTAATMVATHNGTSYTTRIYQNPYDVRNTNRPTSSPAPLSNLARFRILGYDANGNYIIRIDGTAEHFYGLGSPLASATPPMSGGEYVEGVDAAMAEESWA